MSTDAPRQVPGHASSAALVAATAMHSSYRAGHTTRRTQFPAAAKTIRSASTARLIARCRALAGMPPRLMVTTWAPSWIAQSIARATVICLIRTTLSIVRIGMSRALGAEPVTT